MGAQPTKCPPSWTTVRRSGSTASSAVARERGSSRPSGVSAEPGWWAGPSARRLRASARQASAGLASGEAGPSSILRMRPAADFTSALTNVSTRGCVGCRAASIWMTVLSGPSRCPNRMVKGLRLAPATRTTSASPMSPAAVSVPKPPATPRYPSPWRRLSARAVPAVSAPRRSASSRSSGPAPARCAPRPARISGRFAPASRRATCPRPPSTSSLTAGASGAGSSSSAASSAARS